MKISLGPDQSFRLEIPGTPPHTILIPQTLEGLALLRRTLLAQRFDRDKRCGTKAAPTQEMVRAFLAANPPAPKPTPKPDIPVMDLGVTLDLGDL